MQHAAPQPQRIFPIGCDAVLINGERFGVYFQHSCRYTILAGSWQLSGGSFVAYYLDALTLERVRACPHCGRELSLHTLDFIAADPMYWYRYKDTSQEAIRALLRTRVSKEQCESAVVALEDYRWSYQPFYSLDRLDRRKWGNWYIEAYRHWQENEVCTLEAWMALPWLEPVVIAREDNRLPELLLGARCVGISSHYARLFIPAFVGARE